MAVPQLSPMAMLPCRRRLPRRQIRAVNKHPTSIHATTHDPLSFMSLPRELRDEILWLAVQDDVDDADLVSRPGPTITALTQVSRSVRVEAASIYWSRTKFHYSAHDLVHVKAANHYWRRRNPQINAHDLVPDPAYEGYCGRFRLTSWLSSWGKLAVPHLRRLKATMSFNSGGLDIQLSKHARPSIKVWSEEGFGAEEYLRIVVTAVLFPDQHSTMTSERLEKVFELLFEVGRMAPPPERGLFIGGIPWYTNDELYEDRVRRLPGLGWTGTFVPKL